MFPTRPWHEATRPRKPLRVSPAWTGPVLLVAGAALMLWPESPATEDPPGAAPVQDLLGLSGAFVLLAGLLVLLPAILRRATPLSRNGRALEVVEVLPLGRRGTLTLVKVRGEEILIGTSDQGMTRLHRLGPAAADPAPVVSRLQDLQEARS